MAEAKPPSVNRRTLLRHAGGGLLATSWLVACGSEEQPPTGSSSSATADIAVGGGVIVDDKYVITQPVAGEFKAFSATCTHQGCAVGEVTGGQIVCPCHGSAFSIEDGSVVNGPAESPLAEEPISVDGGQVTLA